MELRQLQYFLAIAECENMTQAAKMIHISQPSLSANLRDLEQELGFQLFNRMGKRLELNDSGRYYARRVQEALGILEEAQKTACDNAHARERIVNCAVEIPVGHAGEFCEPSTTSIPTFLYVWATPIQVRFLSKLLTSSYLVRN